MNYTIEDYSEKAIAVFGDTKPISDRLSSIQGSKFNPSLRGVGESKRPGWIFPKTRRSEVENVLQAIKKEIESGDFKPSVSKPVVSKPTSASTSVGSVDSSLLSRIEILEAKVETLSKALANMKTNDNHNHNDLRTHLVPKGKSWADEEEEEEIRPKGLLRSSKK